MNGLSETRCNACLPIRCKTCLFYSHVIGAESKLLCPKESLLVSCYSTRLIGQRVVQRNFRVGNDSAAGVAHSALKGRSNSRSLGGTVRRANQKQNQYPKLNPNPTHTQQTTTHQHPQSPSPTNRATPKK